MILLWNDVGAHAKHMRYEEAERIFERFGARVRGGDAADLRRAWISLAKRYHGRTDADGVSAQAMTEINAAHDVLKRALARARGSEMADADPRRQGVCVWAWAGHPGGTAPPPDDRIGQADDRDRDRNFVKRRLWLLSEGAQEEWAIWPFDGRHFMNPLIVYGGRQIFGEMARAALSFARVGFRRPRAIFVQQRGEAWADLLLIHSDGLPRPAIPFRHGGGAIPARDLALVSSLPARLDEIRRNVAT